jgi:tripartite-type tricarboxylate transporter receptor subunit TctC
VIQSTRAFDSGFSRRACLRRLGAAAAASLGVPAARAQDSRVVRIVVPLPVGNSIDAGVRMLADGLRATTGRNYVVDNKPGAGGLIGAGEVAKAKPDGGTLLMTTSGHLLNAVLQTRMPYDVIRDFTPISQLAVAPAYVVLVRPDSRFKTLPEVLREAKARPGVISYGSYGVGNPTHVIGAMFARATNADLVHVPYRGSPVQDFLGGQFDLLWLGALTSLQMIQDGQARPLAVTSPRRIAEMPDVPTLAELGHGGVDLPAWLGVWGPPKMAPELVQSIYADLASASRRADYQAFLKKNVGMPVSMPPQQFAAFTVEELARYRRDIAPLNIRID